MCAASGRAIAEHQGQAETQTQPPANRLAIAEHWGQVETQTHPRAHGLAIAEHAAHQCSIEGVADLMALPIIQASGR